MTAKTTETSGALDIDAMMDEIVKDDEPETPVAAPDDEPAPVEGAADAEIVAEEQSESDDQDLAPEPRERSGEALGAAKAMKVAGWTDEDVDAVSEDSLLRIYQSKLKNDTDVRRTFQENAELRQRIEKLEGAKEAERDAPAATEDLVPKELVELFGEDEARAITSLYQKRGQELQSHVARLEGMVESMVVDRVWTRLVTEGVFGQELQDDAREKVLGKATALAKTGEYEGLAGEARLSALMVDAAKLVLPAADPRVIPEKPTARRAKGNGTVKPTTSRKKAQGKPSTKTIVDSALDAIVDRGIRDVATIREEAGLS